jgi:hypothetical protein
MSNHLLMDGKNDKMLIYMRKMFVFSFNLTIKDFLSISV